MLNNVDTDSICYNLWTLYFLKVYYEAGNQEFIEMFSDYSLDGDGFYTIIWEALDYAAPISEMIPVLDEDGEEVDWEYKWRFSSNEMVRCYKLLKLINRMSGGKSESNSRIKALNQEIEGLRCFYSYSFDYGIVIEKKDVYIEVIWDCEFTMEMHMCIWIAQAMKRYREYLPELGKEFAALRHSKRENIPIKHYDNLRSAA